jgi:hypothetical protein
MRSSVATDILSVRKSISEAERGMRKTVAAVGMCALCLAFVAGCKKGSNNTTGGGVKVSPGGPDNQGPAGNRSKPAGSGKAQLGVAQNAHTHVEVYEQTLAVTKELAELLGGVKDEASAKAAKQRFEQLQDEGIACAQRMQQLGAHRAGVGDPYLPDIKRYSQQVQTEWQRINGDATAKAVLGKLRI